MLNTYLTVTHRLPSGMSSWVEGDLNVEAYLFCPQHGFDIDTQYYLTGARQSYCGRTIPTVSRCTWLPMYTPRCPMRLIVARSYGLSSSLVPLSMYVPVIPLRVRTCRLSGTSLERCAGISPLRMLARLVTTMPLLRVIKRQWTEGRPCTIVGRCVMTFWLTSSLFRTCPSSRSRTL